ncbi:PAS domain-containing protein [Thauera humireducens]|uniref:PAS domain-containing protein n=1 Tax=Thauera humireducens TaxID=1134435 RepID=UPI00311DAAC6
MEQSFSSSVESQASLSGLLAVLDAIGALIFAKDCHGHYTYANQRFLEAVGLASPDIRGKSAEDLFDEDTARKVDETDRKVLETGQTIEHREFRISKSGGAQRCFLTVKTPAYDQKGRVVGMTGVAIDITDSERTETQLRESRQMLDAAISAFDGHLYMKGPDRRYLFVSPQVAALFRRPPSEILGRTDAELLQEQDALRFRELDDKVYATGQRHAGEEVFPDAQGRLHHYWSIKLMKHMGDKGDCLIGFSSDITELKEAEVALARSEARFRSLFEGSTEALIVFDAEQVLDCNAAALKLLGLPGREAARGLKLKGLSPPLQPSGAASEALMGEHLEVVKQTGCHRFEWILRRAEGGAELPTEITLSAIELDLEPAILATIRDLTERRAYEEKIHKLAFYDALTHLPNRRLFSTACHRRLRRANGVDNTVRSFTWTSTTSNR